MYSDKVFRAINFVSTVFVHSQTVTLSRLVVTSSLITMPAVTSLATSTDLRDAASALYTGSMTLNFQLRRSYFFLAEADQQYMQSFSCTKDMVKLPILLPIAQAEDPNDLQYIQGILETRPTSYLDEIQEKLFQNREILVSLALIESATEEVGLRRSVGDKCRYLH
jgi:hypothetical protein